VNYLLLSALTDEELLSNVYSNKDATQMEVELAARLQHALDELAKYPKAGD
jgi:hypothetical protein